MKIAFCLTAFLLSFNLLFASATDTLVITSSSNDQYVKFSPADEGKIIVISLPENRSTGYLWVFKGTLLPALKYIKEQYIPGNNMSPDGQPMMGVPGTKKYIYQITGNAGTASLHYIKKRPTGTDITETFKFTVEVAGQKTQGHLGDTVVITKDSKSTSIFKTSDGGKIVAISLQSNPSTGYSWATPTLSGSALKFIKDEFIAGESKSADGEPMVGVPGIKIYYYQLTGRVGTVKLKFVYKQAWNKDETAATKFEHTVVVRSR